MREIKFGKLTEEFGNGNAKNITFCVTEECNLRCKYCYLVHKNATQKMPFEVAKKAVDYVLSAHDIYNKPSVIWDFIGGEPFLEIDLVDKISDYIKDQMYIQRHPWFNNYIFSFTTNGLLYNTEKVQKYIKKNAKHLSISISVDGNKIKHDMQRVYPDGRGSYNDVVKNVPLWLSQFNPSTKATFSHADLPYLKDSIIHLWNLGIKEIAANVVFENVWDEKDPEIFENQLKDLADYIIEKEIYKKEGYSVRFFDPLIGFPLSTEEKGKNWCGAGTMLAVDCAGNFFPCIRFVGFSLNKNKAFKIGDINMGIIKDRLKPFKYLTINKLNNKLCENCKVASGCMACTGFSYDNSKSGTLYERSTYNCDMHKANVRACDYFWEKVSKQLKGMSTPRDIERTKRKGNMSKYLVICLDGSMTPYCNYKKTVKPTQIMSPLVVKQAIEFAKNNYFIPVFLGNDLDIKNVKDYIQIVDSSSKQTGNAWVIFDNNVNKNINANIAILLINKFNIENLFYFVEKLVKINGAKKINIVLQDIMNFEDKNLETYKEQLMQILEFLLECDDEVDVNVFSKKIAMTEEIQTDILGCEAGINNFAVMPNGKIYICPGFYFLDENINIGDLEQGINFDYANELMSYSSAECGHCKNYNCRRCVYLNKISTNEYTIPPDIQCKISRIENDLFLDFVEKLKMKKRKEWSETWKL